MKRAFPLLAALVLLAPAARGEDAAARAKFVRDGDARALVESLAASKDPLDRAALPLARLAADPAARPPAGSGPRAALLDALRTGDLPAARAAATAIAGSQPALVDVWLFALVEARSGRDEGALTRLCEGGAPVPARDAFDLALAGAALPPDDRVLLGALVTRQVVRAASDARHDLVAALADAATAFCCTGSTGTLKPAVTAVRGLRRAGRDGQASALLARLPAGGDDVKLERALLAWRAGNGAGARAAVGTPAAEVTWPWAFAALSRAAGAPRVVPGPGFALADPTDDPHAAALARLATLLGTPTRPPEVASRAAAASLATDDPRFPRTFVEGLGGAVVLLAGDVQAVRDALGRGLPVVLWWPRRHADAFADHPVVLRGHDAATDLCVADEPDPDRPDVVPAAWAGKARVLVALPAARKAEAAAFAGRPSARFAEALSDALARAPVSATRPAPSPATAPAPSPATAPATAPATDEPLRRLASLVADADARPVLDLHVALATWIVAIETKDVPGRARAASHARASSAREPVLAFERFVRSMERVDATASVEGSSRDLAEAGRMEGPAAYLETARFVQLEGARRHDDAMAALASALVLDPFDVRTLYFRAGTRRLLGDARGARADLVRVLDRRPDMLAAAEDLANLHLEDGEMKRALGVVEALSAADPELARGPRARQLRQRAEIKIARRARDCGDLMGLEGSPEAESRKEVAWAASSFETPEAEAMLRRLLSDPDEGVRRRAAQAFQRPWLVDRAVADPALASVLALRLSADESPVVREALAVALGRVGSDAAISALVARLVGSGREPLGAVRAAVIEAVAATDRPGVRRALVVSLADDDVVAREAAIRALARMTGTDRGFRSDDPPAARAPALAAWEKWAAEGAN